MKLLCLPYAGGSSISYNSIYTHLESYITIDFLEIPGHGNRAKEPLLRDITSIVDTCFDTVCRAQLDTRYAIYGHSMGAVVGYLLTRKIVDHGFPPPEHLFVSGRQGPAIPEKLPGRHLLPKDQFLAMLEDFEGSPREVLANQELMEYYEPILRADFQACDSYNFTHMSPVPVPITVMYGEQEANSHEDFFAWDRETTHDLEIRSFPGGHFFIFDHALEIGTMISETLRLGCPA